MSISPFDFMAMENLGLLTTKNGKKNAIYNTLDKLQQQSASITPEFIEFLLDKANLTAADLTFNDQTRLNSYLTI